MVNDYPKIQKTPSELQFKTGDLLAVSYNNFFGSFVSAWSGLAWSHVSFVYVDSDSKVWVIEAARYKKYRNVFTIPLEEWLIINKNHSIIYSSYNGPQISDSKLLRGYESIKNKKLDTANYKWRRFLSKSLYNPDVYNSERFVCYELIIILLQRLNIVKKLYNPSAYWPGDIIYGRMDLEEGIRYLEPILINDRIKRYI
jgi:hypothetical protein